MTPQGKAERGTVRINAILPVEMYERLRRVAYEDRRAQTAIMRDALERYLADRNRKRKGGTR